MEEPGSASTIQDFIKKSQELGRKYVSYVDMGRVSGLFKAYKAAKDAGLGFIPGVELRFPAPHGTPFQYVTITVFAKDQAAYQEICKIISRPTEVRKTLGDDEVPYFSLKQLKSLKGKKVEFNFHGLHSSLGKALLSDKVSEADKILKEIGDLGPVSVSVIAAKEDGILTEMVELAIAGQEIHLAFNDRVEIDMVVDNKFKRIAIKAQELVESDASKKKISAIYPGGVKITIKPQAPEFARSVKIFSKRPEGCLNKAANRALFDFAMARGIPVYLSDNAYMASPGGRVVQDAKLQGERLEAESLHMLSEKEATERLLAHGFLMTEIASIIQSTEAWSDSFNSFELKYNWRLPKIVENEKEFLMEIIKKNGLWNNSKEYVDRFNYEMELFHDNGVFDFLPYFVPLTFVFDHYKKNKIIRSPGRGSAGASLISYYLGITQLDPIKWNLPFERFWSRDRLTTGKLPDIDVDSKSRVPLVGEDGSGGLLKEILGDKFAQISTRGNLRLKSSIQSVARLFNNGEVPKDILKFSNALPAPPQGVSDTDYVFGFEDSDGVHHRGLIETDTELQNYAETYSEQWEAVKNMLGVSNSFGRHASGFVLLDVPVHEVIPTMTIKGHGPVTQYEAKEVEAAGGIKYDFLVLNQLNDIEDTIRLIHKKNGTEFDPENFLHNGKMVNVWNLPQKDPLVIDMIRRGDTSTTFQVHTPTMAPLVKGIQPNCTEDFSVILALGRPGPLDFIDEKTGRNMAEEYIERRFGRSESDIPELDSVLPETHSILTFQEQISKVAKEIGKMSGERAEILRDNMCKKRKKKLLDMKPEFMEGARETVGDEVAEKIWNQMETFAQYGFSCFPYDQKIMTNLGPMEIGKIKDTPGILVETYNGLDTEFVAPSKFFDQGEKEVFEIALEDKTLFRATMDHKFLNHGSYNTLSEIVKKGSIQEYGFGDIKIVSVKSLGTMPVCDIEVPGTHNFLLPNGIIAHNCIHSAEYATITYASVFLKANYPLEWWSSVLKNSDAKRIKDYLWKYARHMILPPDINESSEDMIIDYKAKKIRNKLSVIRGFSEAGFERLVKGRPYKDLQSLVDSGNVGDSMLRKMMHVGVLDSLTDKIALIDKMHDLESAFCERDFKEKMQVYEEKKKEHERGERKIAPRPPKKKEPEVPQEYLSMDRMTDAIVRKSLMPAVDIDVTSLVVPKSEFIGGKDVLRNSRGKTNILLDGFDIKDIENGDLDAPDYFCCAGIVVSAKMFEYSSGRALKMLVDTDGYEREVVLWPDYETKELKIPEGLTENSVVSFFYSKSRKNGKIYLNEIVVEKSGEFLVKKKKKD